MFVKVRNIPKQIAVYRGNGLYLSKENQKINFHTYLENNTQPKISANLVTKGTADSLNQISAYYSTLRGLKSNFIVSVIKYQNPLKSDYFGKYIGENSKENLKVIYTFQLHLVN